MLYRTPPLWNNSNKTAFIKLMCRFYVCLDNVSIKECILSMPIAGNSAIYKDLNKSGIETSGEETQKLINDGTLYKNLQFAVLDDLGSVLDSILEFEMYISNYMSYCHICNGIF